MNILSRRHYLFTFIMLMISVGNVYSQVDFGTGLNTTKYYESMRAADPPAGNWQALDYNDSNWNTYTNPLAFPQYDAFWVRRTFFITDNPANHSFQIKVRHDDEAYIYINGHLIHEHYGVCDYYNYIDVPNEYLVSGSNILAAYVNDSGGGDQFLECFINTTDGSDIITDLPSEPLFVLSQSNVSLYYGVEGYSEYTLSAQMLTPTGKVDSQVSWKSSNQNVATVNNGHVVAKSAGKAVITASTSYKGVTYSKGCTVEVHAIAQGTKLVIVNEPGTLGSLLTDDEKDNTESLTVIGKLNGDDIHVLRYMAGRDKDGNVSPGKLADLDLYNVDFVNGNIYIKVYFKENDNYNQINDEIHQAELPGFMFWHCNALKSIVLPKSISKINSCAFYHCSSLNNVVIPSGVINIDECAFEHCTSLTSIDLPDGLTSIGAYAFHGCTSLASIVIPDGVTSIASWTFNGCSSLTSIVIPDGVTSIGGSAFAGCTSLMSIDLPDGLTNIEESVFGGCSSLTSIVSPDGVASIGRFAFDCCSSLKSIVIPDGVTCIGYEAFWGCTSLTSIVIPYGVTSIGEGAFFGCTGLTSLYIPESITDFSWNFINFSTTPLTISIPCTLTCPPKGLFEDWGNLRSATITVRGNSVFEKPVDDLNSILYIVDAGMYDKYASTPAWNKYLKQVISVDMLELTTVETTADPIQSDLFEKLGDRSLYVANLKVKGSINSYDIMSLRNKLVHLLYLDLSEANIVANDGGYEYYTGYTLPADNVLGAYSFNNTTISSIIMPKTLKAIGENAFEKCQLLETVVLNEGLDSIAKGAFVNCKRLKNINLPNSLVTLGKLNWYEDMEWWSSEDAGAGVFQGCTSLGPVIIIPDKVTAISEETFMECSSLDSVIIGKNVEVIGLSSFARTGVSYVSIGKNVKIIRNSAFERCSNLKTLQFGNNNKLSSIGNYAFRSCNNLQEVLLPYSVESIGRSAFASCSSLKYIKIPSMAREIGDEAFGGCDNIENIYTYTVEPTAINQNTFSCFLQATLNVPKTSALLYKYDTQWSQFVRVREFEEPYDAFYLNGDFELTENGGRLVGEPDADMYETSGFIVQGNAKQELKAVELVHNGTDGPSIIGASGDVTGNQVNLTAQSMNVNISVEGNRWYFFCFPFNVVRDSISCTTDYVFYSYDGGKRAKINTGWQKMPNDFKMLQKDLGYIFQASRTGILTIHVGSDYLTFTANNEKEVLSSFTSDDPTNAHWNFLGNPFISYYDVQDLAQEYNAPIVVWNGKGYDVYKGSDGDDYQLKPFEAFFVQKETGSSHVEFLPENRITYNKAQEIKQLRAKQRAIMGTPMTPDRQLVNITIMDGDSVTDRTRIVYSTKASMDYEIGVDAAKFQSDGVPQIYTLNGTARYAINERPMGGDDIKLGYIAPKAGVYTLSVPRQDAEIEIYDNVAQAVVDFTFGDYTFESKAGTFNDRFVVRRTGGVTAVEGGFRLDGLTVVAIDGGIDIEGQLKGKVSVYSESGMLIAEPAQAGRLELADGVYIVKIGERSVKIHID